MTKSSHEHGDKRPTKLEGIFMAKHRNFLRSSSIFTLDVLAVLAGTIIATPFALVLVSPFIAGF